MQRLPASASKWLQHASLQNVFDALEADGAETRVVGGAVRNSLLGFPVADVDLATTLLPHQVLQQAEKADLKAIPTGIDHGTVTIVSEHKAFEITTLRCDIQTFGRQAKVSFGRNWFEDASRRDFTMNALYADRNGSLFDPLQGVSDCVSQKIRFIGDPEQRIKEDYLRILRFFRFHACYGRGAPLEAELEACEYGLSGLLTLSAERIWAELKRFLVAPHAARCSAFMQECGVWKLLFDKPAQVETFKKYHAFCDEFDRGKSVVSGVLILLGAQPDMVSLLRKRLHLSNVEVNRMKTAFSAASDMQNSDFSNRQSVQQLLYLHGRQACLDGFDLYLSRSLQPVGKPEAFLHCLETMDIPCFPVSGSDLLACGYTPGKELGQALEELKKYWIYNNFEPDRTELLKVAGKSHV